MSTSSVRRLKERGGGGGAKITAATTTTAIKNPKTLTPQSEKKPIFSNGVGGGGGGGGRESIKRPTGKENPRPTSRARAATATVASHKPVMKAMPRIDKASAAANVGGNLNGIERIGESRAEPRPRWSTSSAPVRGRSSSPSEFNRVLSNSKVSRVSSVEQKRGNFKGLSEKCDVGKWRSKSLEKSGEICKEKKANLISSSIKMELEDSEEKSNVNGKVKVGTFKGEKLESCLENGVDLGEKDMKLVNNSDGSSRVWKERDELKMVNKSGTYAGISKEKDNGELSVKESRLGNRTSSFSGTSKEKDGGELSANESKMVNKSGGYSGSMKEKDGNDDRKGSASANVKYPSKVHEKLAFLEGKVKRIASDIKRTKEMLDMNNPDASKVILLDIQEKISGIEKAVGHVVNNGDTKTSLVVSSGNDDRLFKQVENRPEGKVGEEKSSVKGLNADELEARLFPHHKLLRGRTSLKSSSGSAQSQEIEVAEADSGLKMEEKSVSSIDENSIAIEFLESLGKEQPGDTISAVVFNSEICEVQETDGAVTSASHNSVSNFFNGKGIDDSTLTTDERLEEFDDQENRPGLTMEEESEDKSFYQVNEIGQKTTTGGWFVSEGESVLLAHDDGSCSFYDITNCEEKALYRPPNGVSPNMWRDCWIIRAPSADGCSGRYVVAASAGNSMVSGFCSWDFYSRDVRAFHTENGIPSCRTVLASLPNNTNRNMSSITMASENQQWWYKPCGPLIASTATCQKVVRVYDIRDGEHIMKWELQKSVLGMDHSSPLHWRNRGKLVLAESEAISLWDVSSLNPQALLSISSSNRKILALHVNNTDAELGGGVRQRISSSEAEGNDGVFCTPDFINVLDFRQPTGIGIKIPKVGIDVQSVYSRGDSVYLGCTNLRSGGKKQYTSQIQQFSLRKQKLHSTYALPESNAHSHFTAITQVWGNSGLVMGANGLGLFVFDAVRDDGLQSFTTDCGNMQNVREVIGPDDLYSPSFDYLASRALLVSRDRPALWRYLS